MLKYYRPIPLGCKRIVEPYLGSGAFVLNHTLPGLGIDVNRDVVSIWRWLQQATSTELMELDRKVEQSKLAELKPSVRDLHLLEGEQAYVRVNVCSVVVGQLSSWRIYPQFKLPIEKTTKALARAKEIVVVEGDASSYEPQDGDFVFVDPPYVGTAANYKEFGRRGIEQRYRVEDTVMLIGKCKGPVMLTYGDGAPELFPMFTWETAAHRKVPNLRCGGTVDRVEYVAYINW
jgi:site-specific DNA-adenine methylase